MTTVATSVRSGHLEVCLLEIDRQCPQWGAHQYRAGVGVGRGSVAGVTSEFSLGCNRQSLAKGGRAWLRALPSPVVSKMG